MRITGIYTITNIITNHIYVGYRIDIRSRFWTHKSMLRRNYHDNNYLQKSFNKYGENSFRFEILEECDPEFLCSQENYWCNLLNSHSRKFGFNIKPTHPYFPNYILSKETIEKLRRKLPDSAYTNSILYWRGRKVSNYTKECIKKCNTGRKISPESIERRKKTRLGINPGKIILVEKYSLDLKFIRSYNSTKEASLAEDIHQTSIYKSIKKKGTCNGYIWKIIYKETG